MTQPRPPAPPVTPGSKATDPDRFRPYKPSHVDSTRGGIDAYPGAKKPKGYVSPY
ncbi:MAG TPA: hypothetical protein VFW47_08000 [Phenylobacterium sp.]|nr:hypothetical protein [Phenylobacterium sp.]